MKLINQINAVELDFIPHNPILFKRTMKLMLKLGIKTFLVKDNYYKLALNIDWDKLSGTTKEGANKNYIIFY